MIDAKNQMDDASRPSLRLWPAYAVLAIAAAALVWIWLPSEVPFRQQQVLQTALAIVLSAIALLLWWLLFSRAPGRLRLLGVVGLVAVFGVGRMFLEVRGVSGDLVPRLVWRHGDELPMPPHRAPPRGRRRHRRQTGRRCSRRRDRTWRGASDR